MNLEDKIRSLLSAKRGTFISTENYTAASQIDECIDFVSGVMKTVSWI